MNERKFEENLPNWFQPFCPRKNSIQQVVDRINLSKILALILIIVILGLYILPPPMEEKTKSISSWTAVPTISLEDKPFSSAYDLIQTPDGGYALLGETKGIINNSFFNDTRNRIWLLKTDSLGKVEWNHTYNDYWEGRTLIQTTDGGYAFAGRTISFCKDWGPDLLIVKTDENGMALWNQSFSSLGFEHAHDLVQTPNEGFVVAGYTVRDPFLLENPWLIKTNAEGSLEWNKTYGNGVAYTLVQTMDEGFAFTAPIRYNDRGIPLVKTNNQGTVLWNYTYGRSTTPEHCCLIQTTDGGFALIEAIPPKVRKPDRNDIWLVKADSDGQVQWDQTFQDSCDVNGLVQSSDGDFAFIGSIVPEDSNHRQLDIQLVKTNANGKIQWQQTYGGNNWDEIFSLIPTTDGGFAFAGATNSFGISELCGDFYNPNSIVIPYGFAMWLVKVDARGTMEWMQTYGGFELVEEVQYGTVSSQTAYGSELHRIIPFLILIALIFSKSDRKK